jgi:hypothetical protein
MKTFRYLCPLLSIFYCAGEPIQVPDSFQGRILFSGYVDTVPTGGEYLLGRVYWLDIDYRLGAWDGVSTLTIVDVAGMGCQL